MIDINDPNFKEGVRLYKEGVSYKSDLLSTPAHHRGYVFEERLSRGGYLSQPWNRSGGYKTSSDLRTLFT